MPGTTLHLRPRATNNHYDFGAGFANEVVLKEVVLKYTQSCWPGSAFAFSLAANQHGRAYTGADSLRCIMSKVANLEKQIQQLSPEELAEFRRWYAEFDADLWDRQFESDVKAGKLDALAEKALRAHAAGQSTKL